MVNKSFKEENGRIFMGKRGITKLLYPKLKEGKSVQCRYCEGMIKKVREFPVKQYGEDECQDNYVEKYCCNRWCGHTWTLLVDRFSSTFRNISHEEYAKYLKESIL